MNAHSGPRSRRSCRLWRSGDWKWIQCGEGATALACGRQRTNAWVWRPIWHRHPCTVAALLARRTAPSDGPIGGGAPMPRVHAMLRRERRYTRAHPALAPQQRTRGRLLRRSVCRRVRHTAPLPSEAGKARARPPPSTSVQTRTIHRSGPKMDPRSISWQRPQGEGEEEAEEEALPFEVWDNGTSRKRLAIWLLAPGRPFLETCTWMWHACEEAMRRARATAR